MLRAVTLLDPQGSGIWDRTWPPSPVGVRPMGPVSIGTLPFRVALETRVAVVVKASFALGADGTLTRTEAAPIIPVDVYRDGDRNKSLIASSDLVPYRPHANVLLHGWARALGWRPVDELNVRLALGRGQRVYMDKWVKALGPRDAQAPNRRTRFVEAPLTYETAAATHENPVGIPASAPDLPRIVDINGGPTGVGFGPISERWHARQHLHPQLLAGAIPTLPKEFPWGFFDVAPVDQRTDFLQGDEWLLIEGVSFETARIQTQLPALHAEVRVYGPIESARATVPVVLDTVAIDAERMVVAAVWRGSFLVADESTFSRLRVVAGVATALEPLSFPSSPPPSSPSAQYLAKTLGPSSTAPMQELAAAARASVAAGSEPLGQTMFLPATTEQKPATPFVVEESGPSTVAFVEEESHGPMTARAVEPLLKPATPFERIAHKAQPAFNDEDTSDVAPMTRVLGSFAPTAAVPFAQGGPRSPSPPPNVSATPFDEKAPASVREWAPPMGGQTLPPPPRVQQPPPVAPILGPGLDLVSFVAAPSPPPQAAPPAPPAQVEVVAEPKAKTLGGAFLRAKSRGLK